MLNREEYIEQAYLYHTLRERMLQAMATQELLVAIRQEVLSTTMLPYAMEFMADELKRTGGFSTAMQRLPHYFTPFQTFLIAEAEREGGTFDFRVALEILEREANYRVAGATVQGIFLFEFEVLCRNRLNYDRGLEALAGDPLFNDDWRQWINALRRQIGMVDFCDLLYVRSQWYRKKQEEDEKPILFGENEGRIALANRHRDPLYLFAALQRHLGYPASPRTRPEDTNRYLIPAMQQKIDRLEMRIKLLEEELRGGINLERFFEGKKEEK
jgi:hypothetical protein